MSDADELVRQFILRQYRKDGQNDHLRTCEQATVEDVDGYDGTFGCDTGCDYMTLEATVLCPHGERGDDFEYDQFGRMADLIKELIREAG